MLDTVKILTNVASANLFDRAESVKLLSGNAASVYFQLYQSDRKERYVPASGSTVQVKFLRGNDVSATPTNQTTTITASNPYAEDRSIWKCDLTIAQIDKVISGGMQVLLTESSVVKTLFVDSVILKVNSAGV